MSNRMELLEKVKSDLETVQTQAAGREADLSGALLKTNEHWKSWSQRWAAVVQLLEERGRALEARDSEATAVVALAESKLEETEAALREWLATAAHVANRLARS
jgi:hypothetical protein